MSDVSAPSNGSATSARAQVEESMRGAVLETVRKLALGLVFLFVAFFFFNWVDYLPPVRTPMLVFDAVLVLIYLSIYLAIDRGVITTRRSNAWGALVSWLAGANILTAAALLKADLLYTAYLGLAFLGAASIILSRRWMAVAILVPIGPWAAVMLNFANLKDFGNDALRPSTTRTATKRATSSSRKSAGVSLRAFGKPTCWGATGARNLRLS
jgi:hypothetical protein